MLFLLHNFETKTKTKQSQGFGKVSGFFPTPLLCPTPNSRCIPRPYLATNMVRIYRWTSEYIQWVFILWHLNTKQMGVNSIHMSPSLITYLEWRLNQLTMVLMLPYCTSSSSWAPTWEPSPRILISCRVFLLKISVSLKGRDRAWILKPALMSHTGAILGSQGGGPCPRL